MLVLAQRYIVERYAWLTLEEFMDIVAVSEVTPGPVIFNLATFAGTRIAGIKGAAAATLGLLVIPFSALYIIALAYARVSDHPYVQQLLRIVRPAAVGLIIVAVLNLFRASVTDLLTGLIAVSVVVLVFVFRVSPIVIVIAAFSLAFILK